MISGASGEPQVDASCLGLPLGFQPGSGGYKSLAKEFRLALIGSPEVVPRNDSTRRQCLRPARTPSV